MLESKQPDQRLTQAFILGEFEIHPRYFCRRWFGLIDENGNSVYTEQEIQEIEVEHGYRARCIHLIAQILGVKHNTVERWGKGVEFNKIPSERRHQYQKYLFYVEILRFLLANMSPKNCSLVEERLHSFMKQNQGKHILKQPASVRGNCYPTSL